MLRVGEMRWAAQGMDDRELSLRANSKEVCGKLYNCGECGGGVEPDTCKDERCVGFSSLVDFTLKPQVFVARMLGPSTH